MLAFAIALCLLPLVPLVRGRRRRRPCEEDLATVTTHARIASAFTRLPAFEAPDQGSEGRRSPPRMPPAVGRALHWLAVAALVVWLIGPMVWLAVASLQPESALRASPPHLSTDLSLDGYTRLLNDPAWRGALAVSVTVSVVATAIALLVAILAGYPLARYRVPGARILLAALLIGLAVNLFWLLDWLDYWWIRAPLCLDASWAPPSQWSALWRAALWGDAFERFWTGLSHLVAPVTFTQEFQGEDGAALVWSARFADQPVQGVSIATVAAPAADGRWRGRLPRPRRGYARPARRNRKRLVAPWPRW